MPSNSSLEKALKDSSKTDIHDSANQKLSIVRIKSAAQMQRNSFLRRVCDSLKKNSLNGATKIEIVWGNDVSKISLVRCKLEVRPPSIKCLHSRLPRRKPKGDTFFVQKRTNQRYTVPPL